MKMRTLLAALLLSLLTALVGAQAPSAEKPMGPALDQLIEQLGDNDYRLRDLAEQQLKSAGVKGLPALRAALKHPDAEVRRRLIDLIPTIETEAVLAPKRITLKMKDKPLADVFAELGKQTDYKFEFYHNDANAKFNLDFANLTFWETVEQLSRTTNLDLQQGWGDERLRFNYREGGPAPFVYRDGSFRFQATGFQLYKHVDLQQPGLNANRRSESLTFTFAVQSEPKLPILGLGTVRLTAAFDSEKNSLLMPSNPNEAMEWEGRHGRHTSRYGNGQRMWYQQTQANLVRVSEKATTVKVLRGTLPLTLLAEQKPVVVAENVLKAKGVKTVIGTTTVSIEEVTPVANTNQIQVRVLFNEDTGGNPNDYSWQNSIYQRLEAQDAKGNKYQINSTNWGTSNGTSLQMTLTYAPPDPNQKQQGDVKLVFQEWKILQHQLNFEFKDLPLP